MDIKREKEKKKLMFTKRESSVEDKLGVWHKYTHSTIYTIDNQQGPTI